MGERGGSLRAFIPVVIDGGSEYDQVKRLARYKPAHPHVAVLPPDAAGEVFRHLGGYWQAIISEADGETTITRPNLRKLLDSLELHCRARGGCPRCDVRPLSSVRDARRP
jgi:hypothetical protein